MNNAMVFSVWVIMMLLVIMMLTTYNIALAQSMGSIIIFDNNQVTLFVNLTAHVEGYTVVHVNGSYVASVIESLSSSCNLTSYRIISINGDYVNLILNFPPLYLMRNWSLTCNLTSLLIILAKPIRISSLSFPTLRIINNASGIINASRLTMRITAGLNQPYVALVYILIMVPAPLAAYVINGVYLRRLKGVVRFYAFSLLGNLIPMSIFTATYVSSIVFLDPIDPMAVALHYLIPQLNPLELIVISIVVITLLALIPSIAITSHYRRIILKESKPYIERITNPRGIRKAARIISTATIPFIALTVALNILVMSIHQIPVLIKYALSGMVTATLAFALPSMLVTGILFRGGEFNQELTRLSSEIWVMLKAKGSSPRVYVVDDVLGSVYNAAATWGNRVFVSRKLLELVNDEELRSILVHELGHLKHNHLKLILITGVIIIAAFIFTIELLYSSNNSTLFTLLIAIAPITVLLLTRLLLRSAEKSADAEILEAGFNPRAYISALGKLARITEFPNDIDTMSKALLTHPTPLSRALRIADEYGIPREEAIRIFHGQVDYRSMKN